ncbi:MAG TPA: PIN domain-containing protein [Candidatus Micrarchaeia archaeon]|nr:PIN domain-containing protein [Candidatus Micrarchaeia archaeon]
MADRRVLDSHAILVALEREPGWERVRAVLRDGEPWMTLVNVGEVVYIVERNSGRVPADAVFADLLAEERPDDSPAIRFVPIDRGLVRSAASLKAGGGLSYADAFAAAGARQLGCPVLTGDPEFRSAQRAGVDVEWLPHDRS